LENECTAGMLKPSVQLYIYFN